MGTHPGVTIRANLVPRRVRWLYRFEGNAPNMDYRVHSNSLQNAMKAVMERVMYIKVDGELRPPPQPKRQDFNHRMRDFRTEVCRKVGKVPPMSYLAFVSKYVGRRRQLYTQAAVTAQSRHFTIKETLLSSFIKVERFDYNAKPDAVPRLIQPRKPVYNARVGRYLRPLEHALYRAIDQIFGPHVGRTVMKGLNASEVGAEIHRAWTSFRNPVAVMFDVSRFDQHVSKVALEWEHSIYLNAFSGVQREELAELLKAQLHNKGFVRAIGGTVAYGREGMRASGDMNTACGNVLIMCGLIHSFMRDKCRYRLIDNGDDCVLIGEVEELLPAVNGISDWFWEMGFTLKTEGIAYVMEKIRFCQTSPVRTFKGWVMVRPPETLAKDMATTRNMFNPTYREPWLTAIGDCGRALNDGVPVSSAFFRNVPKYAIRGRIWEVLPLDAGIFHLAKGMKDEQTHLTVESRLSYARAFGIAPWEQVLIEQSFNRFTYDRLYQPVMTTNFMGLAGYT